MWSESEKLIARIFFIPVTGIFVFLLFTQFGKSLNDIIYSFTEDSFYHIFFRFDTRDKVVFWFSVGWTILHIVCEMAAYFSDNFRFRFRRLLTNLRYAPIAVFIISVLLIPIYDAGMIEYSKRQIRNYVFSNSQSVEEPELNLYNDYHHWCGNGAIGRRKDLYFDVAAEGIDSANPKVRTRALLMTYEVWDFLNGSNSEELDVILKKSCSAHNAEEKNTAEKFLQWRESNCQKFLSSN